jgi:hypothetical protein
VGRSRLIANATVVAGVLFATASGAIAAPAQLAGAGGCIDFRGRDGCTPGRALGRSDDVAVSQDGRFVYVGARTVAVFARGADGGLTQLAGAPGCVSPDTREVQVGPRGACGPVRGARYANELRLGPGDRALYVLDTRFSGVAVLARDGASGRLRQLAGRAGCVNADGGGGCTRDRRLENLQSISITADGRSLYAVAGDGRVVAFSVERNGGLSPLAGPGACLAPRSGLRCRRFAALTGAFKVVPSADGRELYAATASGDLSQDQRVGTVVILNRATSGRLAPRRGHGGAVSAMGDLIDLSSDPTGATLWLTRGSTYKGFFTETSLVALVRHSDGSLIRGTHTTGATGLVFGSDGLTAYGLAIDSDAVLIFGRDPSSGALSATPGCISEGGTAPGEGMPACVVAHGLSGIGGMSVSADGHNLYVASGGWNGVAAFALG